MDVPVRLRQHGPAQDGLWALVLEARKDKAVAAFLHGQRDLGASFIMTIFRPGFDLALLLELLFPLTGAVVFVIKLAL
jgi:hypothetical protein